jgi:D-arabinose 1-dehydrogenase-like Zn-dependent alcohol dehydrogenase
MQTMKAAVLDRAPGGLRIEEIPVPEPKTGEVLVRVGACGVVYKNFKRPFSLTRRVPLG